MILRKERDPRLITEPRGGTLTDAHHLGAGRAWVRGEVRMSDARNAAFAANAAGRGLPDPAHDLGAAAYAIKAAMAAALPDDERQRDDICWNVFRE